MCPPLCDPVFGDDDDLVSAPDRGQPVGDGDGCPVFGELFQALLKSSAHSRCQERLSPHPGSGWAGFSGRRGQWRCAASVPLRGVRRVLPHRCHIRPGVPG